MNDAYYHQYDATAEEDEAFAAVTEAQQQDNEHRRWEAEQTRDLLAQKQYHQMCYDKLHKALVSGMGTVADLEELNALGRALELRLIGHTQPKDYA